MKKESLMFICDKLYEAKMCLTDVMILSCLLPGNGRGDRVHKQTER